MRRNPPQRSEDTGYENRPTSFYLTRTPAQKLSLHSLSGSDVVLKGRQDTLHPNLIAASPLPPCRYFWFATADASVDTLELINFLIGMNWPHTHDGIVAGTIAQDRFCRSRALHQLLHT